MSVSPISSITRAATRDPNGPLNILTFPTHERYETLLARTGHNFYSYHAPGIKHWNTDYAEIPDNYMLLDESLEGRQVPLSLDLDLVLSQNKFGQFQIAHQIADTLHLPMVSLEHTLPIPFWDQKMRSSLRNMRADANVFISEYSIEGWNWDSQPDTLIIKHGVDSEAFKPEKGLKKESHILSVVNDWINRDWCCGFTIWQEVTKGLPVSVLGDTPGLSKPASSFDELVRAYQSSRIFLNTSTISPVPTSLLEAMACGCAVVSTATCMIPEIIENGVNGFISNDEEELKEMLVELLNNEELAKEVGEQARKTILEDFSEDRFVNEWNKVFDVVSKIPYTGRFK